MDKSDLILDCSAIKSGGGQQLATGFLSSSAVREQLRSLTIVAATGSKIEGVARKVAGANVIPVSSNVVLRMLHERTRVRPAVAPGASVFTFFGAGLGRLNGAVSVVNCAYPIICYPDSPYWQYLGFRARVSQRIKNSGRVSRLAMANAIVCETPVMKSRLVRYAGIPEDRIHVVPPAVSSNLVAVDRKPAEEGEVRFIYVTGLGKHKNVWRLGQIERALADMVGDRPWTIALTCTAQEFDRHLAENGQPVTYDPSRFKFLGSLAPDALGEAYASADCAIQLSDLESVSNNFLEAAFFGLPMICSDRDFARGLIAEGGHFAEPHDVQSMASAMSEFISLRDRNGVKLKPDIVDTSRDQIAWWADIQRVIDSVRKA